MTIKAFPTQHSDYAFPILPVIVVFCIVTPVGGFEVVIIGICISFPAPDTAVPTGIRKDLVAP